MLASLSTARILSTSSCRDRGRPSLSMNSGLSSWPLKAKYARIAATGHISFRVLPMYRSIPCLVWSVFEPFRWIFRIDGFSMLSTDISRGVRCHDGSNCCMDCTVNSPDRRKAKNPIQQAAQSRTLSQFPGSLDSTRFICSKTHGVIGSLLSCDRGRCLLRPRSTSSNLGQPFSGSP